MICTRTFRSPSPSEEEDGKIKSGRATVRHGEELDYIQGGYVWIIHM